MIEKLMDKVYWIGVTDWGIRHFHGHEYSTHRGTTYNSYLVMDEKIAVVDTVWNPFSEKFLENVRSMVDPKRIDLIVANHAEPDHSGSLGALVQAAPQAKVIVSRKGLESIPGHYHENWDFQAVKTGDTLPLGETP